MRNSDLRRLVQIRWSYGVNLTLIGNAVFVSMDIPDVFLAVSDPSALNGEHNSSASSPVLKDLQLPKP